MRYRISTILLSCLAMTVTLASISQADDGGGSIVAGGALQPTKSHPSVRMVSEVVDAKLGGSNGDISNVYVRCQFIFKNDGPAQDVVMAFPEKASSYGDPSPNDRLRGFTSWVDDKPVKITYRPSAKSDESEDKKEYNAWYVKTVHFDAGQTRKVVDMYASDLGAAGTSDGWTTSEFTYVLRTGASWKGRIGKATINMDTSAGAGFYDIKASPKGCKVKGDKYTWVMTNFEPKQDISLVFSVKMPLVNGKRAVSPGYWNDYAVVHGVLLAPVGCLSSAGAKVEYHGDDCTITFRQHNLRIRNASRNAVIDGKRVLISRAPRGGENCYGMTAPIGDVARLLGGELVFGANHTPNVILKAGH